MKFTLLLKNENDSSEPVIVSEIERTGPLNAANAEPTGRLVRVVRSGDHDQHPA